jgi:predicted nucleotidyltransferase
MQSPEPSSGAPLPAQAGAASPSLPWDRLAPICRRNGIARLALFGSRLKGTARPDSDVDLLVAFAPDQKPGLFGLARIEIELGEALGLKVDLRTPGDLSRYFREEVERAAQVVYAS